MAENFQDWSLARWLIDKTNTSAYRSGKLKSGQKHPKVDGELLRAVGGRENLIRQAMRLEKLSDLSGKISFDWRDMNSDIRVIHYEIAVIPILCKYVGVEDPRQRQMRCEKRARAFLKDRSGTWLEPYCWYVLEQLEKGNVKELEVVEDEAFLHCLREMSSLQEPEWKRVFSARIFSKQLFDTKNFENVTPSKVFEKVYQGKILEVLKKSPFYEEEMTVDELLEAHGILTYSQTLEWKGNLVYCLEEESGGGLGKKISTASNIFGTVINAQTLEHARPISMPGIKKILIIENKANYESMPYSEDALYIYCHGFFSPKEVRFLKRIRDVAEKGTSYYHWGDMDYGGIRIFLYNERNIFPELEPYQMGEKDYEACIQTGQGIGLSEEKRKKLEALDAGKLEGLKEKILKTGLEMEQEMQIR